MSDSLPRVTSSARRDVRPLSIDENLVDVERNANIVNSSSPLLRIQTTAPSKYTSIDSENLVDDPLTTSVITKTSACLGAQINRVARAPAVRSDHGSGSARTQRLRDRAQTATCGSMELKMTNLVMRFVKNESGATAIEYGLIAAGISVAIIAVVNGIGTKLNSTFSSVQTQLK
jgi:pilus assembly protein Flp/PilA